MSNFLLPHESQHARPPGPSPSPGVHTDSRPSSRWCHPAISSSVVPFSICPQSLPASVFSNKSTLHIRWPKYWSFSFSIIPSKEIPGLIFRMGWLDLLAVQGTLKSLLQHHSSKASILRRSATYVLFWPQCIYAYQCLSTWSNKIGARSLTLCDSGSPTEKQMPFMQSDSWLKGKSLDHENLSSPSSGLRAPGTPVLKASIPRILHTCLQPSSWTHSALVSLCSKYLAVWRSSCLRKEGLRVELEV